MSGMTAVAGRARRLAAVATPGDVFAAVILAALQAGGSYAISSRHGQAISPAGYALLVIGPAALLGRRRFPVAVLAVTVAAAVGFVGLEPARGLPYFALIVAFVNAVLRSMVRLESVLVSVFGTAGGLLLGGFGGWALAEAGARSSGLTMVSFPGTQLIVIAVLGAVAGVVAAIRPARRAARLPVLRAIAAE